MREVLLELSITSTESAQDDRSGVPLFRALTAPHWKRFFHLELNLKSGAVIHATVARSTGFKALDDSAITALPQWRWKPNLWREVEIPVTFTLQGSWRDFPKGAEPIPRAYN